MVITDFFCSFVCFVIFFLPAVRHISNNIQAAIAREQLLVIAPVNVHVILSIGLIFHFLLSGDVAPQVFLDHMEI